MADDFNAIPTRTNGQEILYSWFNAARTAGLRAPAWKKYTVGHADFQTAGLTSTIELFEASALTILHGVLAKHTTAFAGTSITAYSVEVGLTGELDRFMAAFDVLQAVGDAVKSENGLFEIPSFASTTSIKITATSVGANLDQSTAGSLDIYVLRSFLPVDV